MKPGIVALVDQVLLYFVPAVLLISVAALLFWGFAPILWGAGMQWVTAIYAAVTVLVMGYPCAMGMATPLALIRGGGIAAERGILMRSGEAFQILKDITHVVFDKTGTITEGRPRLIAVEPLGDYDRSALLCLAAGAEAPSEHPLARAVVQAAEAEGIASAAASGFEAITGRGVSARVEKHAVLVGTPAFLAERGIDIGAAREILDAHEGKARTTVLVAVDDQLAGLLAIADAIKPDAREAIAELKRRGLTPVMITGDNARTAEAVAAEVGIEEIHAQVLPQDKSERVRALQRQGARVAMVGDGINDAPALMQAHVGIAIGAGTDIAIEAADVVLIGHRLTAVPEAITIGGMSYHKTVQNLTLAFLFNGVGVPVAATGILHPAWAMGAMAASVSAVLANSFGGGIFKKTKTPADDAPDRRGTSAPTETDATAADAALTLAVPSIHCRGCVDIIEAGLRLEAGIARVSGDAETKTVRVAYRSLETSPDAIASAVIRLGHRVERAEGRRVT